MDSNISTSFQGKKVALTSTLFGLAGGLLGWILGEIQTTDEGMNIFEESLHASTGVWFALVLLGVGTLIVLGDSFNEKNYSKFAYNLRFALPSFLIAGFLSGVIAQEIYESLLDFDEIERALYSCRFKEIYECSEIDSVYRPARAIGWLTAGALGGTGVGLVYKSKKRVQNGFIGGAAGGLLGGLLFDSVDNFFSTTSDVGSRAVALLIMGVLIAGMISLVNVLRTDLWLTITSGEMKNSQFIIYDDETLVGTARNIPITLLGDSTISEHHIKITRSSGTLSFATVNNAAPVTLNGTTVTSGTLKAGDLILIGRTELSVGEKTSSATSSAIQNPTNFPIDGKQNRPDIYQNREEEQSQTPSPPQQPPSSKQPPTQRPTIQMKPKE